MEECHSLKIIDGLLCICKKTVTRLNSQLSAKVSVRT